MRIELAVDGYFHLKPTDVGRFYFVVGDAMLLTDPEDEKEPEKVPLKVNWPSLKEYDL